MNESNSQNVLTNYAFGKIETALKVDPKSNFAKTVLEDENFPSTLTPHEKFVTIACLEASNLNVITDEWNCSLDDIFFNANKLVNYKNTAHVSFLKRSAINRRLSIVILKFGLLTKGWQLHRIEKRGRGNKAQFVWKYLEPTST